MSMLLPLAILAIHSVNAACPADSSMLAADVHAARRAYNDWAWDDFDRAITAVRTDIGCLNEVIPRTGSVEMHLLFALAGARKQDSELTEAAFRGLLAIDPAYSLDPALAPQGGFLRVAFDRARNPSVVAGRPLPAGAWFLDGRPGATEIPSGRATLIQLSEGSSSVLSWYVDGRDLPESLAARLTSAPAPQSGSSALAAAVKPQPIGVASPQWPDLSKPPAREGGGEQDAAVVVGVSDYVFLPDVAGAADNASDWYLWLKQTRGVPSVKILRDSEATQETILAAARDAAARVSAGGTLWFVFVGHGAPSQNGQDGVLVGADAQLTAVSLYSRSVLRSELVTALEAGSQAHTVAILDACFSGRSTTGTPLVTGLQLVVPSWAYQPSRSVLLTAARSDQFAGTLPGADRPAFSYLLLGALRGWADRDADGQVLISEAMAYTSDALFEVVKDRRQEPEILQKAGSGAEATPLSAPKVREAAPDLSAMVAASTTTNARLDMPPSHPWALAAGSGAALVASGVLYLLANNAHDQYYNLDTPAADVEGHGSQARAFTIGWGTAGTIGLALGATTLIKW